jgi:hypothetical protein
MQQGPCLQTPFCGRIEEQLMADALGHSRYPPAMRQERWVGGQVGVEFWRHLSFSIGQKAGGVRRLCGMTGRSTGLFCAFCNNYWICVITRCADTERVPPAIGVMVSAVELAAGFRTVSIELITVVVTRDTPTI